MGSQVDSEISVSKGNLISCKLDVKINCRLINMHTEDQAMSWTEDWLAMSLGHFVLYHGTSCGLLNFL